MKRIDAFDVAAILLLLWASAVLGGSGGHHRYSYYVGLRNVVCLAWLVAAVRFYFYKWWPASVVGAGVAWFFNPIAPVYMRKWQWQPYDHGTMLLSVAAAVALGVLSYHANVEPSKSLAE